MDDAPKLRVMISCVIRKTFTLPLLLSAQK
jgi:hypothetical protein